MSNCKDCEHRFNYGKIEVIHDDEKREVFTVTVHRDQETGICTCLDNSENITACQAFRMGIQNMVASEFIYNKWITNQVYFRCESRDGIINISMVVGEPV